jgi:FlaA1/EpsC-like NDP-sugar epimerase
MLGNAESALVPVGFVDDDPLKKGRRVHGLPVHGDSADIPKLLESGMASFVVVASSRIPADRVNALATRLPPSSLRRMRLLLEDVAPGPLVGALVPHSPSSDQGT